MQKYTAHKDKLGIFIRVKLKRANQSFYTM